MQCNKLGAQQHHWPPLLRCKIMNKQAKRWSSKQANCHMWQIHDIHLCSTKRPSGICLQFCYAWPNHCCSCTKIRAPLAGALSPSASAQCKNSTTYTSYKRKWGCQCSMACSSTKVKLDRFAHQSWLKRRQFAPITTAAKTFLTLSATRFSSQ